MQKRNSLFEVLWALKSVIQSLFKKMPVLFLVIIYLMDLLIRGYLSAGLSTTFLLGFLILIISIGIYISTKSFSETTLSFILGILTIYSIDWGGANIVLFIILYLAYIILVFYISAIRLAARQESILIQAACKLDMKNFESVYAKIKKISEKATRHKQLSIIEKCEIIRYLSFRRVQINEYESALNIIELIKSLCQTETAPCCEIYYGLYTYCKNQNLLSINISNEIERMFDKITMIPISYLEFIYIFSKTKRILVEKKLTFDEYLLEIMVLATKGYSGEDISDLMKEKFIK